MTGKISGELDYRIRYDVEHDLFHPQNIFSDEYITPTFVEYVQKLEAQIEKMKMCCNCNRWRNSGDTFNYDNNDYPCYAHDCDDKCKLWELIK